MLDPRFLRDVREVGAGVSYVSLLVASETKSLFEAFLSFFWSEFPDFYDINIHDIRGFGHHSRGGEGLEGLGRPPALLGNLFCAVPLILEVDGF